MCVVSFVNSGDREMFSPVSLGMVRFATPRHGHGTNALDDTVCDIFYGFASMACPGCKQIHPPGQVSTSLADL